MSTEIYYFTGTGNSLAVARDLAVKLNGTLVPVADIVDRDRIRTDAEVIGVVFPIYDFKPPRIIGQFVRKLEGLNSKYVVAVCTYGIAPGNALQVFGKDLESCGGRLAGGFAVRMPHNGIGAAAFSAGHHEQMYSGWKRQRDAICEYVRARKEGTIETKHLSPRFILSGSFLNAIPILLRLGVQVVGKGWDSMALAADEHCNGCGICKNVCPVDNIAIVDRKPVWSDHCQVCFACLHWCPKEAVQAGPITVGMTRYHHPGVTLADMVRGGAESSKEVFEK